ncbi:MAG: NAD(P)H-quinone oxidoreductase [Propionibacteriaceae bacterium]|nr:NAD(P)H-quinone oxidoreductase [Propionibacteriaceae bacterium]
MQAVTVVNPGGPEQLAITDVAVPEPAADEVRIKVVAAGVNRADILQRQGFYPPPKGISEIIGLEVSGYIDAVGASVTGWDPSDPCVALLAGGGYAEYVTVPVGQVIAPPPGVDLVSAAGLIEVAATVVSNFEHVGLRPGETLLIHGGTGGIGSFAIQYAAALHCRVIATAGSDAKLKLCRDLGADFALDYHEDWPAALQQVTNGAGADVILDIMGAKYLEDNVKALSPGGRLVVIGLQGGRKGTLDLNRLLTKAATITATSLRFRTPADKARIVQQVARDVWPLFATGAIHLPPQTRFPFTAVADAHHHLESGTNIGKILLVLPT